MLDIDTSRALRSVRQLSQLIQAVLHAEPEDELDWIEWKSDYDLGQHDVRGHLARHILGMANRDPVRARTTAGGCGYILLGVEPGRMVGVEPIDMATLEPQIEAFLADGGPVWQSLWMSVQETHVLVIIVDPPEPGDPIHTLDKQFAKYDAGDVFVRRQGATHKANPQEIRRLTERATGPEVQGHLRVELHPRADQAEVRPLDLSETCLDAWVERERARLMAPLERASRIQADREQPSRTSQGSALAKPFEAAAELGRQLEQMNALTARVFTKPEDRSPEKYRSAVDQYLAGAREALPDVLADRHMATDACLVELVAVNPMNLPFRSVEFELYIPGDGFAAMEGPSDHQLPAPPRMWGDRRADVFDAGHLVPAFDPVDFTLTDLGLHGPGGPWVDIENGGSARLRFSPLDLPPRSEKSLAEFQLVALAELAGTQLHGGWSARSTHAPGIAEGTVTIAVTDSPATPLELMDADMGE